MTYPKVDPVGRRRVRRLTLATWLVTFLASLVWSLANPMWGDPDSVAHSLLAYSVVHDDPVPDPIEQRAEAGTSYANTRVPEGLLVSASTAGCFAAKPSSTPDCVAAFTDSAALVDFANPAGRYLPVYYWIVGLPTYLVPIAWALWAQRVATAAVAALMIAWAATAALTGRRPAVAVTGVLVGVTPMVLFLAGAVNPNSLEIAAALAMGACTLAFLREPSTWLGGCMLRRAILAATLVLLTRPLAPLWVGAVLLCLLVLDGRSALAQALRRGRMWWLGPVTAGAVNIGWSLLTRPSAAPLYAESLWSRLVVSYERIEPTSHYQQIGWFGWLDTRLTDDVYVRHLVVAGFLVALAWVLLNARAAWAVISLVVLGWVIPYGVQISLFNAVGPMWQGRYILPISSFIPVAAFMLTDQVEISRDTLRRLAGVLPVGVLVLFSTHVIGLTTYLRRLVSGGMGLRTGPWQPPLGSLPLLGVMVGLLALVLAAYAWGLVRDVRRVETDPVPAVGPGRGSSEA